MCYLLARWYAGMIRKTIWHAQNHRAIARYVREARIEAEKALKS